MTVNEITGIIEAFAPLGYQESYDNVGLLVGAQQSKVNGVLLTIDTTPEVVNEALERDANLIISHHPLIFKGLKRLTGSNYVEKTVIKAIKHGISIYAAHTNLDNIWGGVSAAAAKRLGLKDVSILSPTTNQLVKLSVFVPTVNAEEVRLAMFNAGAGQVGNYDWCSYNVEGTGTFRAGEGTSPHVGELGKIHLEPETKIEVIVPKPILGKVLKAMLSKHPYEEVAYDIFDVKKPNPRAGLGVLGVLPSSVDEMEFLYQLKKFFKTGCIRHSPLTGKKIKTVAICGGSGADFIGDAISAKADIYITADIKYHQFFDAEGKLLIADVGHFESEQFAIDIFYEVLTKKMPNFVVLKSNVKTNPINYL
jgi:dinuclear metal center YbgI/SA1388 family protein